jgi:prevent-host-death family protein
MTTVNVHEAKTHLSDLLARAERGEEIVIARAGKPIVRLEPIQQRRLDLGFLDVSLSDEFFVPMSDEELAAWE